MRVIQTQGSDLGFFSFCHKNFLVFHAFFKNVVFCNVSLGHHSALLSQIMIKSPPKVFLKDEANIAMWIWFFAASWPTWVGKLNSWPNPVRNEVKTRLSWEKRLFSRSCSSCFLVMSWLEWSWIVVETEINWKLSPSLSLPLILSLSLEYKQSEIYDFPQNCSHKEAPADCKNSRFLFYLVLSVFGLRSWTVSSFSPSSFPIHFSKLYRGR